MNTAKIVAMTKPSVAGVDTADEFVAYAARVSNPSNQMNNETAAKLIQYCMRNNHWSIFEMVNIVMEIETTRDIARQILRHRSFSFQEFSQRYADPTQSLGFVTREARLQDAKNRQSSTEIDWFDPREADINKEFIERQGSLINQVIESYDWALANGIAKEQARVFLPEGLTVSKMYMNGTLRSWIHYCNLRMANGTQKEHREVATNCWKAIMVEFTSLSV